ncbi:MAG: hypothetical protein QOE28_1024 [Solirubrobacteraceae bacterium]|jgi:hypothetical protein|nr:hypothetical protein [Solirubrobacteraceae bacterium]
MRRLILLRAATAAAIVVSVAVAGCGGSSTATDSSSQTPATDSAGSGGGGGGSSASVPKPKQLAVGDATTLKGLHGSMKVQVLKIQDPMPAPPPHGLIRETPVKGNRFVGVQVKLTNLGSRLYSDSLLNGAGLTTDVAKAARPTILLSGKCRSKFGTSTRVPAGATKTGCLPFQVSKKAKVSAFVLTLDSGYGPEKGTWAVR